MGKECCGGGCHTIKNQEKQQKPFVVEELIKSIAESGKKADGRR